MFKVYQGSFARTGPSHFAVTCLLALLAVGMAGTVSHPCDAEEDWPRFLGEDIDGVATDVGLDWSKPPELLWNLDVGDGYGMGSVSDGMYFQCDATTDQTGRLTERLRCIDLQTGKTIWSVADPLLYRDSFGYEDGPRSSPTISEGKIYTLGVAGKLNCRQVSDGSLVWSNDTNQTYSVVKNFFGVGSSPLVLEDQLIVMVGGSPPEDQQFGSDSLDRVAPDGSAVVAFDRNTGAELWKCGDDLASYSSPRPITIDGNTYVLVFARGGLMLIDPKQGKVRWRYDHRASDVFSVNAAVPVVDGDLVFISECYEVGSALLRVSAEACQFVWKDTPGKRDREWSQQSFRAHWATPLLIDGFLYGGSGRNAPDSDFRCIDLKSGKVQWSDRRATRSTATRVGDLLLVLEERGTLQLVRPNPEKLEILAQMPLGLSQPDRPGLRYPCWAAPIVVGDLLLLRGDANVLCLRLATK